MMTTNMLAITLEMNLGMPIISTVRAIKPVSNKRDNILAEPKEITSLITSLSSQLLLSNTKSLLVTYAKITAIIHAMTLAAI